MAGFDYLIDSEYSGAPGNSFLFNFLQIFAAGTIISVHTHTARPYSSDEREAGPANNKAVVTGQTDGGNDVSAE